MMIIRARPLGCFVVVVLLLMGVLRLMAGGYISVDGFSSDWWLKPNLYSFGDPLELIVNKVESDLTHIPFGYYELPFTCPPTPNKKPLHLSLNEIMRGDRKWQSDYKLQVGQDKPCEALCARKTTRQGIQRARELVQQGYVVQWMVDQELPAATTFISTVDERKYYASGFPLGFVDPETKRVYLNNHVMLVIRYHVVPNMIPEKVTIVGFEVYPKSVSDYHCPGASKDYAQFDITDEPLEDATYIPVTYSVYWREEFDVDWSERWSLFLNSGELSEGSSATFHWMTLANSLGIVLLVTFIVVVNLVMIFRAQPDSDYDFDQESDEKAVYAVASNWLRKSQTQYHSMNRLIMCVSMGVQVMFMILGPLAISFSLNRLHNIRNSVLTIAVLCVVAGAFMASFAGTWLKMDHCMGTQDAPYYPTFAILCGSTLPVIMTLVALLLNCIIWAMDFTNSFPFGTIVFFGSWYSLICILLSLLGGSVAAKMHRSVRHNRLPSSTVKDTIIKDRNYKFLITGGLISGLLPFVIIYVELEYVYKSVWLEKTTIYYLYSFLFANILLLCIVVCEISLLACLVMMKLNHRLNNDVHWRWRCFFISTGCAWYMELYSLYYIFCILNMRGPSLALISVCYSVIFNTLCGLATGSLGYLTSSWFVNKVYGNKYSNRQ